MESHAFFLDAETVTRDNTTAIRLYMKEAKDGSNGTSFPLYARFLPYFFLLPDEKATGEFGSKKMDDFKKSLLEQKFLARGRESRIIAIDEAEKSFGAERKKLLKITASHPGAVSFISSELNRFGVPFENNIPFHFRFVIDSKLTPCAEISFEKGEDGFATKFASIPHEEALPELRVMALDIESYSSNGAVPEPSRDPSFMISYAMGKDEGVLTYKHVIDLPFVENLADEKAMLERITQILCDRHVDVLCTYNGDQFDLPYLTRRAEVLGAKFRLGRTWRKVRAKRIGMRVKTYVPGRIHFDVYQAISFLNTVGSIKLSRLTLNDAYFELFGKHKVDLSYDQLFETWRSGKGLEKTAEYSKVDSIATLALANYCLNLELAFSRLVGLPFFESSRSTAGQLVEFYLMRKSFADSEIIPNKPSYSDVQARMADPLKGAFVKTPEPGVYENIAVLDFRSLYPSIIVSHNIDPSTKDCSCCSDPEIQKELGHHFCKKRKGIIPRSLEEVLTRRFKLKKMLAEVKKQHGAESKEYNQLYAEQWALKVLANSFYGYLAYPRSRWYDHDCGEATTGLARKYIKDTMDKAELDGFKVLYGDSLTGERFVTILDSKGFVSIKNISELFEEQACTATSISGKEQVVPRGISALSVDPETGKSCWKRINAIIRHKSGKRIFRVNQKHGETRVTEDHSLIVAGKTGFQEVKPTELGGNEIAHVREIPQVKSIGRIDLFEILNGYCYALSKNPDRIASVQCDDSWVWFGWRTREKQIRLKRFIDIDSPQFDSLCRLLGAYVAEGSSSTPETTQTRFGSSISSENTVWLQGLSDDYNSLFDGPIASILSSSSPVPRTVNYKLASGAAQSCTYVDHTEKLQMMNTLSAIFFKMLCGQKSTGKKLPQFIFHVPASKQRVFLEKMIEGDGSHSVNRKLNYTKEYIENNFSYTTRSLELICGVSFLLAQLGYQYSIQYRASKDVYTIKTASRNNSRLLSRISEEKYDGYVYDLSVDGSHMFVDSCGQVLLHNTDSLMITYPKGAEEKISDFQKKVNVSLPGNMELELEDIYTRGLFVSKKGAGGSKDDKDVGAKKKYALINKEGKIKIRGFELVRRDWSGVAKTTQRKLLSILLETGDVKTAAEMVMAVITELKAGKIPLDDLTILTQLRKKAGSYAIVSPELSAVQKARAAGVRVPDNAVIGYVIGKKGKSISEKAVLRELATDYDADYYINNQVIPATLKLLSAFGYDEDALKSKGTQSKLGQWG